MHAVHVVSLCLFLITALLLVMAEIFRARGIGRAAVLLAIVAVIAADAFMLMRVPEIGGFWQSSGVKPAKKKAAREGGQDDDDIEIGDGQSAGGKRSGAAAASEASAVATDFREAVLRKIKSVTAPAVPASTRVLKDCPDCPEMVVLPPGVARNAALPADHEPYYAARVTIWPGFGIGRDEVSVDEFARFVAATGHAAAPCAAKAGLGDGHQAVACVRWADAAAYVGWLSRHTGHHYRLPTATEWLYAADQAPHLSDAPRGMAAAAENGTSIAEMVADCWRDPMVAVAYGAHGCVKHTVVDVPADADRSGSAVLARVPLADGARSAGLGFRVVRALD